MEDFKTRTRKLISDENLNKLQNTTIVLVGLGGVGSYVFETLVRVGIGNFILIDFDTIDVTNINRQILATNSTIRMKKVELAKKRGEDINSDVNIKVFDVFYTKEFEEVLGKEIDGLDNVFVIDAIDSVCSKIELIQFANSKNIPIVSCCGTGNRLEADFKVSKLSKTKYDPIAKRLRNELKKGKIKDIFVLYSDKQPDKKSEDKVIGSVSYVPAMAGLKISEFVVKKILEKSCQLEKHLI